MNDILTIALASMYFILYYNRTVKLEKDGFVKVKYSSEGENVIDISDPKSEKLYFDIRVNVLKYGISLE